MASGAGLPSATGAVFGSLDASECWLGLIATVVGECEVAVHAATRASKHAKARRLNSLMRGERPSPATVTR